MHGRPELPAPWCSVAAGATAGSATSSCGAPSSPARRRGRGGHADLAFPLCLDHSSFSLVRFESYTPGRKSGALSTAKL
jgi:hypothetical protein